MFSFVQNFEKTASLMVPIAPLAWPYISFIKNNELYNAKEIYHGPETNAACTLLTGDHDFICWG